MPGGRKASAEEVEARIEWCAKLLRDGKTKTEIHKAFKKRYKIQWGVVDLIYITRARKWILERTNISHPQARAKVLDKMFEVLERGDGSQCTKAAKIIVNIFGLAAPTRVETTGRDGGPIETAEVELVTPARMLELAQMAMDEEKAKKKQ